jgi:hypothetical protein
MNLQLSVELETKEGRNVLVDLVLRSVTTISRVVSTSLQGAAEENTEVFIQVGQEGAKMCQLIFEGCNRKTYYWLELVLLAGRFFMRGAAPPPSRKLTEAPIIPPLFVEANPPLKYGRRLTSVLLTMPGARIPGTLMPTFGWVSGTRQRLRRGWKRADLQLPMTAVLTTRVNKVNWFAAVLFFNRAVV